jgi:hypothetical protein
VTKSVTIAHPELRTSLEFQGLTLPAHPTSGTEDDDDDRDGEHVDENEAPGRAVDESTEAPEEFEFRGYGGMRLDAPDRSVDRGR